MANNSLLDQEEETPYALSTGDLMAALLMVFVLLLMATLLRLQREYKHSMETSETYKAMYIEYEQLASSYGQLTATYYQLQEDLFQQLLKEFEQDLPRWNAVLDRPRNVPNIPSPRNKPGTDVQ